MEWGHISRLESLISISSVRGLLANELYDDEEINKLVNKFAYVASKHFTDNKIKISEVHIVKDSHFKDNLFSLRMYEDRQTPIYNVAFSNSTNEVIAYIKGYLDAS